MAQGFSLNDQLFNPTTVGQLGQHFEKAGVFASAPFVQDVVSQMGPLALKERINLIAQVLADYLPDDFPSASDAILRALPPPLDPSLSDDDFGHFIYAPLGVYVEKHGLDAHLSRSLDMLTAITQRFSMEFSVRAFLNRWPDETLARMRDDWACHDSYHVRRLVSEGTRPKLPWGQAVGLTPAQTLPLLDALHGDRTRFVTRSVANHLNDITKKDPDLVIDRLSAWQKAGVQDGKELTWMRKHALRGLIKAGHAGAMAHLGYDHNVKLSLTNFAITPDTVTRGDTAEIRMTITPETDAPLIIDYVIDFMKANGAQAPKVFKLKVVDAKAGVPLVLTKRHVFKDNATTFRLYPGPHQLHAQVNGRVMARLPFVLT
ncbi:hypothetical protein [Roseobacter sp. CCS2]|uniref:hypothetical protein n=1 Tax=Roseobacter sp. CCS2 TaxID=391593 RepID=UPI0000F405B3|nr:hypothetical protein [Roseobacter sp. CCS2]EBA11458.1 hypothetical protein RCCS2_02328 [Roseobacter sp. CCS2]